MTDAPVHPGDILAGKYRVERVLGSGNMGVVVAARHVELGQLVALKLMLPGKAAQAEHRARFLREAKAAVRLRSHHVARVFDVGTLENDTLYIVMEFLAGRDLGVVLRDRGRLPVDEAVEYVLQTCEAVGEAHAAGIVHRDLKPANLFLAKDVTGSPCVKVVDFGISKLAGAELSLTQESQALGSPLYMSPEQIDNSKGVDPRSDVWALGITLYQLVTGMTPFHAATFQELYKRIFLGRPTPLATFLSDAPSGFEDVILRCLERDREQRFQSVAALATALGPYAPARARIYTERVSRVLAVLAETQDTPDAGAPTAQPVAEALPRAASPSQPHSRESSPPLTEPAPAAHPRPSVPDAQTYLSAVSPSLPEAAPHPRDSRPSFPNAYSPGLQMVAAATTSSGGAASPPDRPSNAPSIEPPPGPATDVSGTDSTWGTGGRLPLSSGKAGIVATAIVALAILVTGAMVFGRRSQPAGPAGVTSNIPSAPVVETAPPSVAPPAAPSISSSAPPPAGPPPPLARATSSRPSSTAAAAASSARPPSEPPPAVVPPASSGKPERKQLDRWE